MSKRHQLGSSDLSKSKRAKTVRGNLSKMNCVCKEAPLKKLPVREEAKSVPKCEEATLTRTGKSNAEHYEFEYLESPLKPASDKKIYKVIKLKNGLRAILISDITNVQTVEQCKDDPGAESESESEAGSASEAGSGSEDESGSDEDGSGSEGESGSEDGSRASEEEKDISDPAADDKPLGRSSDKLQCDGQEKLAAVGLTVGVGSFSDPEEIPGLAHFLEHMVFMGSVKYPAENHFDSFVKRQGGSDNAHTDCETTTFYFECQEKFLREGMDMFSQFFSAPLLKKEAMTRERKAVESEFQESLSSDDARWTQLVAGLAQEGHPATKFTWGNAETLRHGTSSAKLHRALHDFRRQHYSGHRFTLAVQARLPLEELEVFVAETFSKVPSNHLPSDDFSPYTNSFETPDFHRLYRVESAKDTLKLNLTWALPPQEKLYRSKPYDFLEDLLDEEGEGSLLAFLKQKLWAFSLHAEHSSSGFETNSMYFLFSICIKLTDEGYRNIEQILTAVFGFLRLMRESGPDERYFDERRRMAEARFHYCEETEASEYVEELSEALQHYPPEDCIAGPHLYFEYNPQVIKDFQEELIPDKVNITILAQDKSIKYDKKEKWFNTKYSDEEIPAAWLAAWREAKAPADCHLPGPNPLVPTDFTVTPDPVPADFPVAIAKSQLGEVWYKRDNKFLQPVACYCFYLVSPEIAKSATEAVLLDLMSDVLDFQLAGELHPARAADISVSVRPATNGLSVLVSGFNQNLHSVLETVFKKLASLEVDNEEVFAEIKLNRAKAYFNTLLAPGKLCSDLRLRVLVSPHWTSVERKAALVEVNRSAVADFARRYRARLYVQCLAQGNITQEQALAAAELVQTQLKYLPLEEEERPRYRVRQIEVGKRVARTKSFNLKDSISVMTNYYQAGLGSIHDICMLEVIMVLMEEPLFDRLRTKEQLGYDVSCLLRDTHGILGFTISVTYQEDKRSAAAVDARIDSFLSRFSSSLVRSSDRKLDEALRTVIKLKRCVDVHLREEVNRNWAEVMDGDFLFDRQQREIAMLEKLTAHDIRRWAIDWLPGGGEVKEVRELSIQVVGVPNLVKKIKAEAGSGKKKRGADAKKESGQSKAVSGNNPSAEKCRCEMEEKAKVGENLEVEGSDAKDEAPSASQKHDLSMIVEDKSFICDIKAYHKELVQFPYHQILE